MPLSDDHQASAADSTPEAPGAPGTPSIPTIADGSERRLDLRSIRAERLAGAIVATIVSAVSLLGVALASIFGSPGLGGALLMLGGWFVATLLLGGLLLWWPVLSYRYTTYEVHEHGMRIRRGVLWRTVSSVPRSRVQHTDVSQGPVERMFELATLVIYTAGTQHASVSLGGLAHDTAFAIRDHLIAGGEDDAV